jgi:hypothetical protein
LQAGPHEIIKFDLRPVSIGAEDLNERLCLLLSLRTQLTFLGRLYSSELSIGGCGDDGMWNRGRIKVSEYSQNA